MGGNRDNSGMVGNEDRAVGNQNNPGGQEGNWDGQEKNGEDTAEMLARSTLDSNGGDGNPEKDPSKYFFLIFGTSRFRTPGSLVSRHPAHSSSFTSISK